MMDRTVVTLLDLLLLLSCSSLMAVSGYSEARREEMGGGGDRRGEYVLEKAVKVVEAEGGEVRVVQGFGSPEHWPSRRSLFHIGFITMEPKTLFLPQYSDSNLLLFVERGEVKVGWIHKYDKVEKQLKMGDILHIRAGSTFHLLNTGKGQQLRIICAIDKSEAPSNSLYQAFYVAGGTRPRSVLSGFSTEILTAGFNVTYEELDDVLHVQRKGPIIYVTGQSAEPEEHRKGRELMNRGSSCRDDTDSKGGGGSWSWRKLLDAVFGVEPDEGRLSDNKPVRAPDAYNLYDRDPDFRNNYGWSLALDEHDYEPLRHSDMGVYMVNLSAGAMMAPHVNPQASEYGIVLSGSGTVEVVLPNGTQAMSAEVAAGDVFWVPRYHPFCQVASRGGPMEFFGFTTSARRNRPQFLVGSSSVLRVMMGPELAAGFGVSEERLRAAVEAQRESTILPPLPEPAKRERERERREEEQSEDRMDSSFMKTKLYA